MDEHNPENAKHILELMVRHDLFYELADEMIGPVEEMECMTHKAGPMYGKLAEHFGIKPERQAKTNFLVFVLNLPE